MTGKSSPKPTVVAIGASAGGLSALTTMVRGLPTGTGMAFVVIIHLPPDHKSALPELLQPHTDMDVLQAENGDKLAPNTISVLSPGRVLLARGDEVQVQQSDAGWSDDRSARQNPIDILFRTLATSIGERTIGIVLTGTGSDGTSGLSHIKNHGGLTIAQDPEEAEFDSMPQTAVITGVVDLVLPVAKMGARLARIAHAQPSLPLSESLSISEKDETNFRELLAEIQSLNGHDFSRYKRPAMLRRIRRRMVLLHIEDFKDYLDRLCCDPSEIKALFNDLLITVTSFFMDPETFDFLEKEVIPKLFEEKNAKDCVRVWVVGCSTGEEAYSLAILLLEHRAGLADPPQIQIFASDIHEVSLETARAGFYPEAIALDISAPRLERFFVRENDGYRVREEVRNVVLFAPHNLLKDPPFSRLDLISCRNLLTHLQRGTQEEVQKLFRYALNPPGYLMAGSSENMEQSQGFRTLDRKHPVFQKSKTPTTAPSVPLFLTQANHIRSERKPRERVRQSGSSPGELHLRALERYAPPSILVDQSHNIVHYSQHAYRYLRQPGEEPTENIFSRVITDLKLELKKLMQAAKNAQDLSVSRPIRTKLEGEPCSVILRVKRLAEEDTQGFFLVFFDELPLQRETGSSEGNPKSDDVAELENELARTRELLETSVEDYETSQEKMRLAHEELLSSNEELRSTLEELETGKEKLQALNDELSVAAAENRHKIEELSRLTSDLQNLFFATDIATIFLNRSLHVQRFTPPVCEIFNLSTSDLGRRLTDFSHSLDYDGLIEDAKNVFEKLRPFEREVRDQNTGQHYLLRLVPYRTVRDKIDGVVLTLVDVTALKKAEDELRERERELREFANTLESRIEERSHQLRVLASRLTLAEQAERDRIARVLHDELQQILCGVQMKIFFQVHQRSLSREVADDLNRGLLEAIELTRRLSVDMSPPVLSHEGLTEALKWLRARMREGHGLEIDIEAEESFVLGNRGMRVLLVQFIRELLSKLAKHANAKTAVVRIGREDDTLKLSIRDDGQGFDPRVLHANHRGSFGLDSVRERIKLFGGSLTVHCSADRETTVEITLPVGAEHANGLSVVVPADSNEEELKL